MRRDDSPPWADDPMAYLAALGHGPASGFDPGAAALAFAARERPMTPFGRYVAHLDQLAEKTDERAADATSGVERIAAMAAVLHADYGYSGDKRTYDDLQNADLVRVIDRRKGLPVALGILHMSVAYRLGWSVVGLNFPGHFLLRMDHGTDRAPFDPFDGARVMTAPDMRRLLKAMQGEDAELTADCYAPVSDRSVLLRLQNNIKLRRLRIGDIPGALGVAEAMRAFAPEEIDLVREIAMMHMRLENITDAIRSFEAYLDAAPSDALRHRAAALLQELKNRLN